MTLLTMIVKMGEGLSKTCAIFFLTLLFSLPLGMIVALLRMSKNRIVSGITRFFISILRGTPLMLQLLAGRLGIVPSFSMLARYLVSIFTFSAKSFRARFFAFRASFTSAPKVSKPGQSSTFAIQHHQHTFYIS